MPRMALRCLLMLATTASAVYADDAGLGSPAANDDPWSVIEPTPPSPASSDHSASTLPPGEHAQGERVSLNAIEAAEASRPLPRRKTQSRAAAANGPNASGGAPSWWRSIGSLAAVVALIVLLAWGYRAAATSGWNIVGRPRRPGVVQVISRAALSPRQSICLVRVGPRMVLVGVTADHVRPLDVIDDAALVAQLAGDAFDENRRQEHAFQETFQKETRRYEQPPDEPCAEDALPEEVKLLGVKRRLADALARARKLAASA